MSRFVEIFMSLLSEFTNESGMTDNEAFNSNEFSEYLRIKRFFSHFYTNKNGVKVNIEPEYSSFNITAETNNNSFGFASGERKIGEKDNIFDAVTLANDLTRDQVEFEVERNVSEHEIREIVDKIIMCIGRDFEQEYSVREINHTTILTASETNEIIVVFELTTNSPISWIKITYDLDQKYSNQPTYDVIIEDKEYRQQQLRNIDCYNLRGVIDAQHSLLITRTL